MNEKFGDPCWDIYANHKGEWCLHESHTCQEGRCIDCCIYRNTEKKWHERQLAVLDRMFSQGSKMN